MAPALLPSEASLPSRSLPTSVPGGGQLSGAAFLVPIQARGEGALTALGILCGSLTLASGHLANDCTQLTGNPLS